MTKKGIRALSGKRFKVEQHDSGAKTELSQGISKSRYDITERLSQSLHPPPHIVALFVAAMESGITKVLIVFLATMFEKANELLQYEDLIVKKPGADDGSYIVAGHTNQIYCVTPGKGGSFKCDQNCVNATTKICEHTIAVAEKYGKLADFIT